MPGALHLRPYITPFWPLWGRGDLPHFTKEEIEAPGRKILSWTWERLWWAPVRKCPCRNASLRMHCFPFPCIQVPRAFGHLSFRLWDRLLVHLDWMLNGYCTFSSLNQRRKPSKARGCDGGGVKGDRGHAISGWLVDVYRDWGRGDLTTIPFPCIALRDMQVPQAVAVGRTVKILPEASQNLEKISPFPSPISIISGFRFQHCHLLLL